MSECIRCVRDLIERWDEKCTYPHADVVNAIVAALRRHVQVDGAVRCWKSIQQLRSELVVQLVALWRDIAVLQVLLCEYPIAEDRSIENDTLA